MLDSAMVRPRAVRRAQRRVPPWQREASAVSGYVLVVYGKEITVVGKPTLGPGFESPDPWTVASVSKALGPWFAGKRPIADGFVVVP